EEGALALDPAPAGGERRAALEGVGDQRAGLVHRVLVDQRADPHALLGRRRVRPPRHRGGHRLRDGPMLRNFACSAPSTAASRSASSNTTKGALPPSSIE